MVTTNLRTAGAPALPVLVQTSRMRTSYLSEKRGGGENVGAALLRQSGVWGRLGRSRGLG